MESLVAAEAEAGRGDVDVEVLLHLLRVDDLAHGEADVGLALEGSALDASGDLRERLFGGLEQLLPDAGAVPGEAGIAAGDEALAGEVRMVPDLEQRLLVFGVLETVEIGPGGRACGGSGSSGR